MINGICGLPLLFIFSHHLRLMKKLFLFIASMYFFQCHAQKGLDGLIHAEKSFAAYAMANGTREAFLSFLDSNGIVFEKGEPVNGLKAWTVKEKRPGILNWHPQFAGISRSGDFGFTSGPWTFQPGSTSDSVVARGQYNTVWHIDSQDHWKFLLDMGVSYKEVNESKEVEKTLNSSGKGSRDMASLFKAESDFIKRCAESPAAAYKDILSPKGCLLNRNGQLPAFTKQEQEKIILSQPAGIQFEVRDAKIARSGDLGYLYGVSTYDGKKDGYLHIWSKKAGTWKLVLEVLTY
jgi:ketosteroid isomerase-like protein